MPILDTTLIFQQKPQFQNAQTCNHRPIVQLRFFSRHAISLHNSDSKETTIPRCTDIQNILHAHFLVFVYKGYQHSIPEWSSWVRLQFCLLFLAVVVWMHLTSAHRKLDTEKTLSCVNWSAICMSNRSLGRQSFGPVPCLLSFLAVYFVYVACFVLSYLSLCIGRIGHRRPRVAGPLGVSFLNDCCAIFLSSCFFVWAFCSILFLLCLWTGQRPESRRPL